MPYALCRTKKVRHPGPGGKARDSGTEGASPGCLHLLFGDFGLMSQAFLFPTKKLTKHMHAPTIAATNQ